MIQVFQIDPIEELLPYTYEKLKIGTAGGDLVVGNCSNEADILAQAGESEILLVSWKPIVTPHVMDSLSRLRLIVRWGVGYDQIDVPSATQRGIAVANAPTYGVEEVAEHTVALLFTCARRVAWFHERLRNGEYPSFKLNRIQRIAGQTLGVIGLGRIGSAVAKRARGVGLNILVYDPNLNDSQIHGQGYEPRTFDQILSESDFITLHVPLSSLTFHLLDNLAISKMKKGAILLNTSRGPIVDELALIAALESGHLASAGLDVYELEPLSATSPLRDLEHIVLTPHMASYSEQSWQALRDEVCDTVGAWIKHAWASSVVNPEVRDHLRLRISN